PGTKGLIPLPGSGAPDPGADPRHEQLRAFAWESGQGRLGSGMLVTGWTDEPLASPPAPELGRLVTGANLVYVFHPLPVRADGDLPPGVVLGRPVDAERVPLIGPNVYYAPPGR